ncbi:glycine--tRNA ligase subunit beta, partial [bacterium]|nr:glycine--tRNA ligase subunit beta [bacterium]
SKIDLSTQLVFEFTELQGFIGEVYARISGECDSVAAGIKEHYFPLASGSEQAKTIEGQVVGIADKIDTFCAMYISTQDNKKKRPTGSNDPLGIRRAIIGIISTIIDNKLDINLIDLINYNLELLSTEFSLDVSDELKSDLSDFILGRLQIMLQQEYSRPVIDSTLSGALENLVKYTEKLDFVKNIPNYTNFTQISDNFNRVLRITKDFKANSNVDKSLFENSSENALYDECALNELKCEDDFNQLSTTIAEFFDKTLVMVEDEKVKSNRLTLLSNIKSKLDLICDFSILTA